jgi:hypothetical protein
MSVGRPFALLRAPVLPQELVQYVFDKIGANEPDQSNGTIRAAVESHWFKYVKQGIADSIAAAHFDYLVRHLSVEQYCDWRDTYKELGNLLRIDRSNVDDWIRGLSQPDGNQYFLTTVAWPDGGTIRSIPLPARSTILRETVRRTINRIALYRRPADDKTPWKELNIEELCCVYLCTEQKHLWDVLSRRRVSVKGGRDAFFETVFGGLSKHFPQGNIGRDSKRVVAVLDRWLLPYLVFTVFRPTDWGFLYERPT